MQIQRYRDTEILRYRDVLRGGEGQPTLTTPASRRAQEGPEPPAKRKVSKKHGFEKQIRKASTDEDPPIWDRKNQPAPRSSWCFQTSKLQNNNTKTKYAFYRGKTPFGDRSQTIQRNHQFDYVHSVEVKRGAAPI